MSALNSENIIVRSVNENTIPTVRATAEYLLSLVAPPKITGRIGITHGESVDNTPAK